MPRHKIIMLLYLLICAQICYSQNKSAMTKKFAIAIHGGAGTILKKNMTELQEKEYKQKLDEALNAGYVILEKGGSAIDATEAAIKIMEDSPLFNAGKGAVFTNAETNELDAAIMNGNTLEAGAVAGVTHIKNPISLAKLVMNKSEHVLMIGSGAENFAKQHKMILVDTSYFFDENRFNQLQKLKQTEKTKLNHSDEQGDI
ncbi:MAG: isoaspartyl peptidase/L-asparaginase, partial [Flavobacteriales bacterium]|nr:isoaspartyl peptidase/L-asparaginase [Flavobacteriales bacterium]